MVALVALFALLVQILVPLSLPSPAWAEEGLFPPTCSLHPSDVGAAGSDSGTAEDCCQQCPVCELIGPQAVEPVISAASVLWPRRVQTVAIFDEPSPADRLVVSSSPRGPPSHA